MEAPKYCKKRRNFYQCIQRMMNARRNKILSISYLKGVIMRKSYYLEFYFVQRNNHKIPFYIMPLIFFNNGPTHNPNKAAPAIPTESDILAAVIENSLIIPEVSVEIA